MDHVRILTLAASLCAAAAPAAAFAQTPKDLAGSWTLVSSVIEQSGAKIEPFGPNPRGSLILEANGRYLAMVARAGLPKIAANTPLGGTAEENNAIVTGTVAHFGTYVVGADKTITFHIETASYPNWDGTEQKRTFTLAGDTLTYTAGGAPGGGIATLVWERAK